MPAVAKYDCQLGMRLVRDISSRIAFGEEAPVSDQRRAQDWD
jgi:hypothetical protein